MKHSAFWLATLALVSLTMRYLPSDSVSPPPEPQTRPRPRESSSGEDLNFLLGVNAARSSNRASPPRKDVTCYLPIAPLGSPYVKTEPYRSSRELRDDIDHLERWVNWILLKPVRRQGKPIGVQLSFKSPNPFARLGMRSGDIVISLNHLPVAEFEDSPALLMELRSAPSLHFLVERNGVLLPLEVNLD